MVLMAYGKVLLLMSPFVSDMVFLFEYLVIIAELPLAIAGFLYEATLGFTADGNVVS